MSLNSLKLTTDAAYDVLFREGWKETITVGSLADLSALVAPNGARVLVLGSVQAVYTLDTARADTADGTRVVSRSAGMPGRWFLFVPDFDLLWVVQSFVDLKLYAFTPLQVTTAPASAPAITITIEDPEPGALNPVKVSAIGFAPNGDAWIGFAESNQTTASSGRKIARYSASKLLATSSQTADFSFALPAGGAAASSSVSAMIVRPNGDLWLSTIALTTRSSGIFKYTAGSIVGAIDPNTGAPPVPSVVLAQPFPPVPDNAQHTNSANDLCFDAAGNLWFTNAIAGTVNRLSAAQLLATNTAIVPDVILDVSATSTYNGCSVDKRGNLWCSFSGRIDMYAARDIQKSGAPRPARRLTVVDSSGGKVRFDKAGNLWSAHTPSVLGFPSWDVVRSGAPPVRATLTGAGALTSPRTMNFNPQSFD